MCSNWDDCNYRLLSAFRNQRCECGSPFSHQVLVKNDKVCDGFVKDSATFIVNDGLRESANSMDTSFDLFKSFGIKSISLVKEMTVNIT
jgi:hypothetical protein